jgi:hypothetical protein
MNKIVRRYERISKAILYVACALEIFVGFYLVFQGAWLQLAALVVALLILAFWAGFSSGIDIVKREVAMEQEGGSDLSQDPYFDLGFDDNDVRGCGRD